MMPDRYILTRSKHNDEIIAFKSGIAMVITPDSLSEDPLKIPMSMPNLFSCLYWEQLIELTDALDGKGLPPRVMTSLIESAFAVLKTTRIWLRDASTLVLHKDEDNSIGIPIDGTRRLELSRIPHNAEFVDMNEELMALKMCLTGQVINAVFSGGYLYGVRTKLMIGHYYQYWEKQLRQETKS